MALSAQHRSILYTEFVDRLGPDVTEAFLAEFPTRDGDEPITKDFLRAELSVTRVDLHGQMADLRTDLQGQMASLAGSLGAEMNDVRTDLGAQMMQVQLAVAALEARIAHSEAAFHKDSKRQLTVIVTAILGMGTAILAGMAVSVAVIVSRMG